MRIFVAGATGAIGRRLVPALVQVGHTVFGMTRSPQKWAMVAALGAEPVIADALNAGDVMHALRRTRPVVVIHELTAIPPNLDLRRFAEQFAATNWLRTQGTGHLLAGARAACARRFLAQSFGGWPFARTGGPIKSEQDPLDPDPPAALRSVLAAIRYLESAVTSDGDLAGIVLRYGALYGPGTSVAPDGAMTAMVRRRLMPIVGHGSGLWSWLHIDDAARATVAAVERGEAGIYNVVDDEPAPVADWLPALAAAAGAKPPRHIPAWLGRLAIGKHGVVLMNEVRGASNQKAKRELGWQPLWPSWRSGFQDVLRGADSRIPGETRKKIA